MIPGRRVRLHSSGSSRPETSVTYGRWSDDRNGEWVYPDGVSYSDYVGSLMERSNYETFTETFVDLQEVEWLPVHGDHGTTGALVRFDADERAPEIGEFFAALQDYPSADDDRLSQLEQEATEVGWHEYGRRDFTREILKLDPRIDDVLLDLNDGVYEGVNPDEVIDRIREGVASTASESPTVEDAAGSVSFGPYDDVLKDAHRADEDALLVAVDLAIDGPHWQVLELLFQEVTSSRTVAMPAFYYALLVDNPKAARIIGERPNALEFAVAFAESVQGVDQRSIVDIAREMSALLGTNEERLQVLTDLIEEGDMDRALDFLSQR